MDFPSQFLDAVGMSAAESTRTDILSCNYIPACGDTYSAYVLSCQKNKNISNERSFPENNENIC